MSEVKTPPGDKPDGGNTPPPPATPPPSPIAGKFKDEAAFAQGFREIHKALGLPEPAADKPVFGDGTAYPDINAAAAGYKHLESLLGRRKEAKPPAADPLAITKPVEQPLPDDADVNAIVARAGIKIEDLQKQVQENGKPSDEQYAALKKQGYPPKVVDQFLQLQTVAFTATVEKVTAKAAEYAGGAEALTALRAWAAENIPADELEHLNAQVKANPSFYPTMVQIIAARKNNAIGASGGTLTTGGGGPKVGIRTKAEFREVAARAERGDAGAIAILRNTPAEQFSKLAD